MWCHLVFHADKTKMHHVWSEMGRGHIVWFREGRFVWVVFPVRFVGLLIVVKYCVVVHEWTVCQ